MNRPDSLTWLSAILAVALLSGCAGSPHNNYYLLTTNDETVPSGHSPSLGIGPVEMAEYLNRNSMVFRQQDNQLHIAVNEKWAEPLADGVARLLRMNLAQLLDTQDVREYPWNNHSAPQFSVRVSILALDPTAAGVNLTADWSLSKAGSVGQFRHRISQLHYPFAAMPKPRQVASASSQLLLQLSELIAADIRAMADQH